MRRARVVAYRMRQPAHGPRLATAETLLAIPIAQRFHEIVNGDLMRKASPTAEHGDAQSWLSALLKPVFSRSKPFEALELQIGALFGDEPD